MRAGMIASLALRPGWRASVRRRHNGPAMPDGPHSGDRSGARPVRERLAPALVLVAALALFAISLPARGYGDDVLFVNQIVRGAGTPRHFLYLPLARSLAWLGAQAGLDPFRVLRLLAASGMAAGGAWLFAAARRRGVD